jgi:hypothetical protein
MPEIIGNSVLPAVHGGFLEMTSIVDVAAELGISTPPKSIVVTINYLRSGRSGAAPPRSSASQLLASRRPRSGTARANSPRAISGWPSSSSE